MTVLAWCLIASTGRVSSSIALRERGEQVVDAAPPASRPCPTRPGTPRPGGRTARRAAGRRGAPRCSPRGARRSAELRSPSTYCSAKRAMPRRTVASICVGRRVEQDGVLDDLAGLAERHRRGVDGERRFVAEEVPDHRRQHERHGRVDGRHGDRRRARVADVAVVGDDDRRRLVRPEDRHLLAHVVGGRAGEPGGAHEDHRLGRQVDVLLVLGDVAGDRLVAELAELDPDLLGRDLVDAVADDRPVALRRCEPAGRLGDRLPAGEHGAHRVGQAAQRRRAARAGAARWGTRPPRVIAQASRMPAATWA